VPSVEIYPDKIIAETSHWLGRFRDDFRQEIPLRIHSRDTAEDGAPQWHSSFSRWLTSREVIDTPRPESPTEENRLRTTRALRRLRNVAVREFEVVYRVMICEEKIPAVTSWLNERAVRNQIPLRVGRKQHYTNKDTSALVFSGIDKMRTWWQEDN
jgi:hypothetical protein